MSEPHVASAQTFAVAGGYAFTGDGVFGGPPVAGSSGTGEVSCGIHPNGKVVDWVAIGDYPQYLIIKDDLLLVEGFGGGEAVVSVSTGFGPAPSASLGPALVARGTERRLAQALLPAASDRRARRARRQAGDRGDGCADDRKDRPASALRAAGEFLVDAATHPDDVVDPTAQTADRRRVGA